MRLVRHMPGGLPSPVEPDLRGGHRGGLHAAVRTAPVSKRDGKEMPAHKESRNSLLSNGL